MPRVRTNGIEIEYETSGPPDGPVLLMIHGLGAQLVRWPRALCDGLMQAGFRIVVFDNRDVGLSTHMPDDAVPDFAAIDAARREGRPIEIPYTLSDMAADTAGLLDALGIEAAHIFGVSLGGMIAQLLAIEHPSRVLSLAIMMSQTGNPDLPPSDPVAMAILSKPAPDPAVDREAYIAGQVEMNRAIGSPGYCTPEAELRGFAEAAADRAYNPLGSARQLAASRAAPDRRKALQGLAVPTVVIHGADDILVPVEGGEDIARNIQGSWLLKIRGMGHDLPQQLFPLFIANIHANAERCGKD
jgi:pimeloyl-ACP methyl ester carboxylesterase